MTTTRILMASSFILTILYGLSYLSRTELHGLSPVSRLTYVAAAMGVNDGPFFQPRVFFCTGYLFGGDAGSLISIRFHVQVHVRI